MRKREMLRVYEKHYAQYQKQRELRKDDYAAREQRGFAVAFVARGQKPLHHGLIGAVAGHGQERSAEQAGPEGVLFVRLNDEIEDGKFSACRRSRLRHRGPTAGNFVQQQEETRRSNR